MIIDVALANSFNYRDLKVDVEGSVVAVIDVVRATSTIAALFGSGASSIIIAPTLDEAYAYKNKYPDRLLCGEVKGHPPEGFDYGNSPLEFSQLDLTGKDVIMKTTNGTGSFLKASGSPAVYSLALLNFNATMERVRKKALNLKKDILFLCSGENGAVAYDDTYVSGLAVKQLMKKPAEFEFTDSAKLVLSAALGEKDVKGALKKSTSVRLMLEAGLEKDLPYCARIDEYNVVIKSVISGKTPKLLLD